MSFEQKTWYNDGIVPDDAPEGTVPPCIDADNLNRIESGITEALEASKTNAEEIKNTASNLKQYADENILYFSGTANYIQGSWTNLFQLPTDIDYSKYIAFFQGVTITNYDSMRIIPYNTDVTLCNRCYTRHYHYN